MPHYSAAGLDNVMHPARKPFRSASMHVGLWMLHDTTLLAGMSVEASAFDTVSLLKLRVAAPLEEEASACVLMPSPRVVLDLSRNKMSFIVERPCLLPPACMNLSCMLSTIRYLARSYHPASGMGKLQTGI